VTPYTDRVQKLIVDTFAAEGLTVTDEQHLGLSENFAFGEVRVWKIAEMIRTVATTNPQAVLVLCTNLRAAPLVADLEAEIGLPILDSVATAVWGALRLTQVSPGRIRGWGRLFQEFG